MRNQTNTIVPVTGDVKGDITQCKIETAKTGVERGGSLSLSQKEHFKTYDVCTKAVINEYSNQSLTATGFFGVVGLAFVCIFILSIVWARLVARY